MCIGLLSSFVCFSSKMFLAFWLVRGCNQNYVVFYRILTSSINYFTVTFFGVTCPKVALSDLLHYQTQQYFQSSSWAMVMTVQRSPWLDLPAGYENYFIPGTHKPSLVWVTNYFIYLGCSCWKASAMTLAKFNLSYSFCPLKVMYVCVYVYVCLFMYLFQYQHLFPDLFLLSQNSFLELCCPLLAIGVIMGFKAGSCRKRCIRMSLLA